MNLQQLEYIIAISELKNFSRAAEYCKLTQATLSAMVKKLEEELELITFDRKTNPIVVTDLGKEVIIQAKKVLLEAKELKNISHFNKNKVEGDISIGIIPTIANALLSKVFKKILNKYTNLSIHISELTTKHIIKQLKEGRIDIGILATPLEIFYTTSRLWYMALWNKIKSIYCQRNLKTIKFGCWKRGTVFVSKPFNFVLWKKRRLYQKILPLKLILLKHS